MQTLSDVVNIAFGSILSKNKIIDHKNFVYATIARLYYNILICKFRYMAISHLVPTNARKVFPCFDEPGFRNAIFLTTLVIPKGYTALSNAKERVSWLSFQSYIL